MSQALSRVDGLVDRVANRLIWRFASKPRDVKTDVPLVSFTFDDVPDSALHNGAAILERHGARGTFYIAGGLAGRVEPDRTLISPQGCADLAARGHEIGCHTYSHRKIRDMSGAALAADLDRNADYLRRSGVDAATTNFAFPYNAAWPLSRRELGRRYRTCRAAGESVNRASVDPLMLKAVEIRQPETEARALTGWIDDVVARPGWLVFFTHDIASRPTSYGCTPETFDHLAQYAVAKGCVVLPVERVLDRLGW
ncbi:polysaccharide deacetylase family protein [Ensifer sp. LC499]|uniref:polysaccharide deacetylase family protein n=1 Tax=unclassified Ensifer TaxID=2633371 RepID=UPI0008130517|nr:polysaccharide deacetylase family protein [Ensifer sp. LC499]OCO99262.1 polysaccharide deacetylase [Ensifer sp. LC11]OCO99466.1 polysaccharide deacetylase [Ensifer sp. LC13]OCP12971.1 polysaccharide deacetylase [Ensifer sp. LC14]OCP29695.1 polysaccharide deacetylase [Ensifer sp. LC499]